MESNHPQDIEIGTCRIKKQIIIIDLFQLKKLRERSKKQLFSVSYWSTAKNDIDKKARILYSFCLQYFEANQLEISKLFLIQLEEFSRILGGSKSPEVISDAIKKIKEKMGQSLNTKCSLVIQKFNKSVNNGSVDEGDVKEYLKEVDALQIYSIFDKYIDLPALKNRLEQNANDKI